MPVRDPPLVPGGSLPPFQWLDRLPEAASYHSVMPVPRLGLVGLLVVALAVVGVFGAGGAESGLARGSVQCQGTRPNHVVRAGAGFGRDAFN